jgi:integrase
MGRPKLTRPIFCLTKRHLRKNFYIEWSLNGKSHRVSTQTECGIEARRFMVDFMANYETPIDKTEQTVSMVIDAYLIYKRQQYVARVQNPEQWNSNYKKLENNLRRIRIAFDYLRVDQLIRAMGRQYIEDSRDTYSNATIGKELSLLNAALHYAEKEKMISNPTIMQLPPSSPPRSHVATADEVRQLLICASYSHVRLFIMIAVHTLSRKTAILELRWDQVDMVRRQIDFNPPGRIATKKCRTLAKINAQLYKALEEAFKHRTTDYVIEFNGRRVDDIKSGFSSAAKKAGLPWLTPHTLRHTGASQLAAAGVSIEEIADLMGDNEATARKHYIKYSPDYLQRATDKLSELYE